jgi:hypothetical protein
MNPTNYEIAKNMFIEGYKTYQTTEDLSEFISRIVIPFFELLACDLEELVNTIKTQTDSPIQVLDYLEIIFNSKLYDSYLYANDSKVSDNYSHYLVILIEFTKYQQYQDIKHQLESIESKQELTDKTFIQDLLMKATIERSQYCLDKMKQVYLDLVSNHSFCYNSITACDELFNANNLDINNNCPG